MIFPDRKKFNIEYSDEMKDFLKKLLNKDRNKRLGNSATDLKELKEHDWFQNYDWDGVIKQKKQAPFLPKIKKDLSDYKNFEELT